jgi:hypothetical protein
MFAENRSLLKTNKGKENGCSKEKDFQGKVQE